MNTRDMRREYRQGELHEHEADPDPIVQFGNWFMAAHETNPGQWYEPNVMTVATATLDGTPSARIVLLKDFDDNGFTFYTNYASDKGRELDANPIAALVFHWPWLEQQVRITGPVEKTSPQDSEQYFHERPWTSQLGAAVSNQSEVIPNRNVLECKLAELEATYEGKNVPLPANWGGYRVNPMTIEFWQGRPNRLHDRLRYTRRDDGAWKIERLAP